MRWSTGYKIFEATVVGAYDLGKLDKELLTVLMEPYAGTDIDSGGSADLESNDGKCVEQIVVETWGLELPSKPIVSYEEDSAVWDTYGEAVHAQFCIVMKHFGWR